MLVHVVENGETYQKLTVLVVLAPANHNGLIPTKQTITSTSVDRFVILLFLNQPGNMWSCSMLSFNSRYVKLNWPIRTVVEALLLVQEFGVRLPGWSNGTQCRQRLTTAATFLLNCIAQALYSRKDGPATRYMLRCNNENTIKI